LRLEDLKENLGEQIAARSKRPAGDPKPRQNPAGRKPSPPHLPREVLVHEPEIACSCGSCNPARLIKLGETTTEVLEKIPARLKVIRHVRPKYACRLCEAMFQAPAPDLPIEKGRPGPGLLAHIAVSKYCDGLPLYRQSAILAREGIDIERATMAEWMGQVAWWVRPLVERIGQYVMAQSVLWTDDTPIRTLAPGTGKTRLSRFWCHAVDPRPYADSGHPAVFYRYSLDGRGERPRGHLEGFSGYLHADAFPGYLASYRLGGNNGRSRAPAGSCCSTSSAASMNAPRSSSPPIWRSANGPRSSATRRFHSASSFEWLMCRARALRSAACSGDKEICQGIPFASCCPDSQPLRSQSNTVCEVMPRFWPPLARSSFRQAIGEDWLWPR
jgi:transposase